MRKLTAEDINKMLNDKILENLTVVVGKGKDEKVVIAKGFKMEHIGSKLQYTVVEVHPEGKFLRAVSGDGKKLVITPKDYKNYQGL